MNSQNLFPYLAHDLQVRRLSDGKIVTLSGYTPKLGFVSGLSEQKVGECTPLLLSIDGLMKEVGGFVPLIKLFGIAIGDEECFTGRKQSNMSLSGRSKGGIHTSAVLNIADESGSVQFSFCENTGFSLQMYRDGKIVPGIVFNQEKLWETLYKVHVWPGCQLVFLTGLAIDRSKLDTKEAPLTTQMKYA